VAKVLFDFDGTLVQPRKWSHCIIEVLAEISPNYQADGDVTVIRRHLRNGFLGTNRNGHTSNYPILINGGII
jgi:phosphoglycolate phosphatase-like HAD superfamily hydrolase